MELYKKYDYSVLSEKDVISAMLPFFQNGQYFLRDDGKIDSDYRVGHNSPWIFVKRSPNRECLIWHKIYFGVFNMLPSFCRQCWKVVVRPKTLKQLFQLLELQKRMDRPCKCGIENRKTVHGLYGGYFYNDSIEEGFDCFDEVKAAVHEEISPDVSVILKRGCTEFELYFGPSNKWSEPTEDELRNEQMLDGVFVRNMFSHVQPEHLRARIMQEWIHFAYQWGDATSLDFNNGKPLFRPVVTYERKPETGGAQ